MKIVMRVAVAALLVTLMTAAIAHVQAPDLLPPGWERSDPLGSTSPYSFQLDGEIRRSGVSSVRIQSREGSAEYTVLRQRFLADAFRGRRIRLVGYLLVADVSGWAGLRMQITGSAAHRVNDNMRDRSLQGTGDWQRCEIVLEVPGDATLIDVGAILAGTGTLWADDFEFAVVGDEVPTTGALYPPQVETLDPDLPRAPRNLGFEGKPAGALPPPSLPPFDRRQVMIPMRDGVQLYTDIAALRNPHEPLPILLNRTPGGTHPPGDRTLTTGGYIFVSQDIRGCNKSQGEFVMNRPARDPRDPKSVDETTDAYDTVEWLIHNVPNTNGRVGVTGVSYAGWLAEVVLLDPHPAVKAVSPQAPMTDTWMGDDFFHQGAFRQEYGFSYAWSLEGEKAGAKWVPYGRFDLYDWFLSFPSLKALTDATGAMRIPTWRRFVEHPAYDAEWQGRAFQQLITRLTVPTLNVGGWWDQEDLSGPQATFAALERFDAAGINSLVVGPWDHGGWEGTADSLGDLRFGSATGTYFQEKIEAPWFAYWLKGQGDGRFPDAQLFDAGTNEWRAFDRWPPPEAQHRRLYVLANDRLSFDPPTERAGFDEFVSDPTKPVPFQPRPTGHAWGPWMTEDQRFVDGRPDVLTWQTEPLEADVIVAGNVAGKLFASTSGTDADWVVKLIDVYPDEVKGRAEMGGYQLMVTGDIMRGRYRRSFEKPEPIRPDAVETYTVDLHQLYYTFKSGHRIMVQVQSTWFPLYDRNPQTFVPNIFLAPASAYRAQTHRVYHTASQPSHVSVMVLPR
jgi:putative CocE/NonD family hydrolase